MDRRTLLALGLTAIVIVVTPMLFPAPRQRAPAPVDSTGVAARDTALPPTAAVAPSPVPVAAPVPSQTAPPAPRVSAETTMVRTDHAIHAIVSPGGTPAAVVLPAYGSLRPGTPRETPVNLLERGDRLFRLSVAAGRDTIALDTVAFRAGPERREGNAIVRAFTSTSSALPITLTYRFPADSFVTYVEGTIGPAGSPAVATDLLVTLPRRIRAEEADVLDDTRHLSIGHKARSDEVQSVHFRDLDSLVTRVDTGSIRWVSERNKYFVVAVVPAGRDTTFRALLARGESRASGEATAAYATAVLPLRSNSFALRVYAGPQSWKHLRVTAPDLENVNPYGGWMHGMVQPFATIVMRMLLWMRETTNLGYGWVLVIFGVLVRLLLWPLNQNAMRSSMKMQRIQPQLAEVQKKYRDNPEKQREMMIKLYSEHGMSPLSPLLGCLPMLLPMPILFALYFVFQNTIELRGVPFLWLPDLSLKDPYYITPLFMGVSMFLLSWIGMRGMPPSPQSKMMAYVMPVMLTVLFWNFASGLNLYYAVQNVAALPQQWLLSRERQAAGGAKRETPPPAAKREGGAPRREPHVRPAKSKKRE
jgi:YidC/Oxa1 family membrane protein insertase